MNLLIYSHGFPNPVEEHRSAFVRDIIRFLPHDIKVTVIAPVPYFLNKQRGKSNISIPYFRTESLGNRNVEIYHPRYPLLPKNYLRCIVGFLEAIFTLNCVRKINKQVPIDLIHVNWAFPDGVAVYCISKLTKIPYVITEHQGSIADLLNITYYNMLLGHVYRGSRSLIIVSESLKKPLQLLKGGTPKPIIVSNGIDTNRFQLVKKSLQLTKLLYIGNLIPGKGVEHLIRAISILAADGINLQLSIVGNGQQREALIALAIKLNVAKQITFMGIIHPNDIPALLLDHDLLVLPTLVESFGIVLIEAMAAGLPVLSTLGGGPQYIISPEVGVLVQPGSAKAIADGIKDIMERWDAFEPQAINDYCKQHYDIKDICKQLTSIYRKAIGAR
ncbi:glycosyltransferase family 4 protein [Candidatus Cloacimonadota bacterium]